MSSPDLVTAILGGQGGAKQLYRVHRKNGQVFALVPAGPRIQARVAPLLPAQSAVARLYRTVTSLTGRCGIGFPFETESVTLSPENAVVALCNKLSGSASPPLLLPGNPNGYAPRLILIGLDPEGQPTAVVKAGHRAAARQLVRQEAIILRKLSETSLTRIAPHCLGAVDTDDVSAFAMEFVRGASPAGPPSPARLQNFLTACIDTARTIPLAESPLWAQLTRQQSQPSQRFSLSAFSRFSSTPIHPCIFHGDFAPWNVREAEDGSWTAIDWERGDFDGIPGWDWLHFVLQPAVLVKKWDALRVLHLAHQTVSSPNFLTYLNAAVPGRYHREFTEFLLRSYLLYNWHVLQPTERKEVHEALAQWAGTGK
jgi:hypothetical protein